MNFLQKIDEIHNQNCEEHSITSSTKFISYIPLSPINPICTCKFLIKKSNKAKVMMVVGSQRVYLSDLDIIRCILALDEKMVKWFFSEFIFLFQNQKKKIKFKIGEEIFDGHGIGFLDDNIKINIFSDSEIHINDFIYLINLVLSKDIVWSNFTKDDKYYKITLYKYIVLIDFYAFNSKREPKVLEAIDVEHNSIDDLNPKTLKKEFEKIKTFEI